MNITIAHAMELFMDLLLLIYGLRILFWFP